MFASLVSWSGGGAVGAFGEARLDRIPNPRCDLDAVEPRDLLDAGRGGDVDLRQPVADHVDPDKNQPLSAQRRPDSGADLAVAGGQLGLDRAGADMEVGARLALRRHAQHRAHRFPFDEYDAFVALPHFGDIALHHHRLTLDGFIYLQQRRQVLVTRPEPEYAGPA